MRVFLLALAVVALCVAGMCFNILFRKDGRFPEYEVGSNSKMKEMGIKCVRQEEAEAAARAAGKSTKDIKIDCDESCSDCRETKCR